MSWGAVYVRDLRRNRTRQQSLTQLSKTVTMSEINYTLEAIGVIRSELVDLAAAPKQGDEGSYEAWLELNPQVMQGLLSIKMGDELIVLTWLHRGQRDVLQVHPRGNPNNPYSVPHRYKLTANLMQSCC